MNTEVEISINGKFVTMTREEALQEKIYEGAMKGKVSNQKFFYEQLQQRRKDMAELMAEYDRLVTEWLIENPRWPKDGAAAIPVAIRQHLVGLETLLNRMYPDTFTKTVTTILGHFDQGDQAS